ncbi:YHYH protein [Mycolicibacterium conceptionense]|uniref:YHYH protein n=1 Tax=Mycolicibacterium conceptionense TaxID=451644 RepID=UPI0009B9373E|nr:YHYH protein [Mycolicibacterium conceptionense]
MRITTPYDYRREPRILRAPRFRPRLGTALGALAVAAVLTGCAAGPVLGPPQNPYPDGVLPVGDGKVTTDGPRKGYVYLCSGFAGSLGGGNGIGGAIKRGPWFTADGKGYRPADKPHVRGDIPQPGNFSVEVSGGRRIISTNGLPVAHGTGQFPVAADDPVRAIDPNPNTISQRDVTYDFPVSPAQAPKPGCVGDQVGVLLRGATLLSPVDAAGRDAVAWEVQDRCSGHPEPTGLYHYHGPSPCLTGTETDRVIGFALDGFPITGNRDGHGRELWSRDLDECHGGVADVEIDGKRMLTYRYVMTRDWPYTVSCFKGSVPAEVQKPPTPPSPPEGGAGPGSAPAGSAGITMPDGHGH